VRETVQQDIENPGKVGFHGSESPGGAEGFVSLEQSRLTRTDGRSRAPCLQPFTGESDEYPFSANLGGGYPFRAAIR
jgi:hypothetical protein